MIIAGQFLVVWQEDMCVCVFEKERGRDPEKQKCVRVCMCVTVCMITGFYFLIFHSSVTLALNPIQMFTGLHNEILKARYKHERKARKTEVNRLTI